MGQKRVNIEVFEGMGNLKSTTFFIGNFEMDLTKIKKEDYADVEVIMNVDLEAKIKITCREVLNTNNTKSMEKGKKNMVLSVDQHKSMQKEVTRRQEEQLLLYQSELNEAIKHAQSLETIPETFAWVYSSHQDQVRNTIKWYKENKKCEDLKMLRKHLKILKEPLKKEIKHKVHKADTKNYHDPLKRSKKQKIKNENENTNSDNEDNKNKNSNTNNKDTNPNDKKNNKRTRDEMVESDEESDDSTTAEDDNQKNKKGNEPLRKKQKKTPRKTTTS